MSKKIVLSDRLNSIAKMVTPGVRMADIGTDHGYLPAYLVQNEVCPSAIAMDVNEGPLSQAKATFTEAELTDKIDVRLSDGLEKLEAGEVETLVIAGMGGALTTKILEDNLDKLNSVTELILQPQSEVPMVRKWLHEHFWQIWDEDMILEDGKYYFVMKAYANPFFMTSKVEDYFGPILLKRRHPLLEEYVEREEKIQLQIKENLAKGEDNEENAARLAEVESKLEMIGMATEWINRAKRQIFI